MSSQMVIPTGTPATTKGTGGPLARGEPPLLVEDPVVGEQALVVPTEHPSPGAQRGGVDQAPGRIDVHVADDRGTRTAGAAMAAKTAWLSATKAGRLSRSSGG